MQRYIEAAEIFTSLFAEIYSDQTDRRIRKRFGNLIVEWFQILLRMLERGRWILNTESIWAVFPAKQSGLTM